MTSILCFDTETSGLCDFRAPPEAPHQPFCLELGWLHSADGLEDAPTQQGNLLVAWPGGVLIDPKAAAVNGFTSEGLDRSGVGPKAVLNLFLQLCTRADLLLGHNIEFDLLIMRIMAAKLGLLAQFDSVVQGRPTYCTKEASVAICKLPHPDGKPGYKWPRLSELHTHFFGEPHTGAHRAMSDLLATWRCYHAIKRWEADTGLSGADDPLNNPYTGGARALPSQ